MDAKVMFSSKQHDWETPDWLFEELNQEFTFFWDAAANKENAKLCNYISTEALETAWHKLPLANCGAWWMNPPYGREIGHWIAKARYEALSGLTVVVLCPARTDTEWWHRHAMEADEVRLIRGRLRFKGAESSAPFPSAILVFRPPSVEGTRTRWSVIDARGRK